MLNAGDLLLSRFRIIRPIARGGMGAVYEARDERLKRSIALKETLIKEDDLPNAFEHEATLLANLSHDALPKVFDHFAENDGQYIVMEFIPGDDLGKLLDKRGGPFSITEVESWYDELLEALEYLHAHNIIHRDIKPSNLKAKSNGGIILLDFGLAKGTAGHMTKHASNKSVLGYTPVYAPLEQIRCEGTTPSTDFYSLGATMYHLVTNIAPVDAQKRELTLLKTGIDPLRPLLEVRPDLSREFDAKLTQALKLEAHDRPASAAEMRLASTHHQLRPSPVVELTYDASIDKSEAPTIRVGAQPTRQITKPLPSPPKRSRKRSVNLSLAICATLALLLSLWFIRAYIVSNKTKLAAKPPPVPILALTDENRELYGGIEIGSKGIKAIVLKVKTSKDVDTPMPLKTLNTTLMSTVAQTGKFSPEAIKNTANVVSEFYAQMRDQFKVATERIHIIGSSGLKKPDKSDVDNKDELVKTIEGATGCKMDFLDTEHEVKYSIFGIIPIENFRTAILVDIGSGNTKGGYQDGNRGDDHFVTMNIPYGTVSFTGEVNRQGGTSDNFGSLAEKLRGKLLQPALREEIESKPGLINRRQVYLTGGIVWAMTTVLHPADRETNVPITSADINTFADMARRGDPSLTHPNLSAITDEKTRLEVEEEIAQINEAFTPQNFIAGAELLRAVFGEFKLPNKKVYFPRFGSKMGWLFKYVQYEMTGEQGHNEK